MKIIHIKSQTSVALPIYTSDLSHLSVVEPAEECTETPKKKVRASLSSKESYLCCICCNSEQTDSWLVLDFQGAAAKKQAKKKQTKDKDQTDTNAEEKKVKAEEDEEEEIPQLVPIETPSKKPKLEVSSVRSCWI